MNFSCGINEEKTRALQERVSVLDFAGAPVVVPSPTEWDLVSWIVGANAMMKHLGRSKGVLFRVARTEGGAGIGFFGRGEEFLRLALDVASLRLLLSPRHDMHPHARLFWRAVEQRDLGGIWERSFAIRSPDWLERYVHVLNDCVAQMRWDLGSVELKRSLERRQVAQTRYVMDLRRYFDGLIAHDVRLRVERLEFRPGGWAEDGLDGALMSRWHALVRYMKTAIGASLIGYAWKRDYGKYRGPLFHLVLVSDADSSTHNEALANMSAWVMQHGEGVFHNLSGRCDVHFTYRGGRSGLLHESASESLRRAHVYLAATDEILMYGDPLKPDWAGCGEFPEACKRVGAVASRGASREGGNPLISTVALTVAGSSKASPTRNTAHGYDILLGSVDATAQFGVLGMREGQTVALDLNEAHTLCLFGVQGAGKSYTLGAVAEMASLSIPGVNSLKCELATMVFHFSNTMSYRPEFTSMVRANGSMHQVQRLKELYGAEPKALTDVLMLVPEDKVQERQREFPDIQVQPLLFSPFELKVAHWRLLMGAVGNQSVYIRQLVQILKSLRDRVSLQGLLDGIDASSLTDSQKQLARMRVEFAATYLSESASLVNLIQPGRLIIVDMRDEHLDRDEALGLFLVLLQLFSDAPGVGQSFNKLAIFDEVHKYVGDPDLVLGLTEVVREMRHKGVSVMLASQDPSSVPVHLIELANHIVLHRFNSPDWLKHLQRANTALGNLTPKQMADLGTGEAYVWSSKSSDESFSKGAVKVQCRPRVTMHGGETKKAVGA